jgi:hypothetical protein
MTASASAFACALAAGSIWVGGVAPMAAALTQDDEGGAITARVHGTFQDASGGLGVLSGDMTIKRFEVRNGVVTALGDIIGSLADSNGNMLGRVNQQLLLPVHHVASTCNQLRLELASADADVLQTPVHFDKEVAGFDSREGDSMKPKALDVLCTAETVLRGGAPAPDILAAALNNVALAAAGASQGR